MNTKLVGISRTRTEQLYSERVLVKSKRGIVQNVGKKGVMEGGRKTGGGGGERQRVKLVTYWCRTRVRAAKKVSSLPQAKNERVVTEYRNSLRNAWRIHTEEASKSDK